MELLNEENFDNKIKNGVVVVDFFATWCGPCRMMSPILEEVCEEYEDKIQVYKVDVDDNENLSKNFGILSIPTILIFVNGEIKEKHVGLWSKEDLTETIEKYL